ncbi:MAG: hypothetical protein ACRDYU_19985 [Actinomycetes bacterium]
MSTPTCSAKGCRATATWALRWNNPKLHTPERRKTWVACDDHREYLTTFLDARGFLRETVPAHELDDETGSTGSPAG